MASLHAAATFMVVAIISISAGCSEEDDNLPIYFRCAPRNVSVLVGSQVRFQCQARWAATSVRWRFNDRGWGLLDHPYASMSTTSDSSWNSSVYSRGLTVEREHNSSRVQCVLTLDLTTGAQTVYSDEAVVIVRDHFWQTPQSINTTLGSVVYFHCLPSTPNHTVSWYLNDEIMSHTDTSDDNITTYTLKVTAREKFNNSEVKCTIDTDHGTTSPVAILMIQGRLAPAGDLRVTESSVLPTGSVLVSWSPPFSLDITDSQPDIWYTLTIHTPEQAPTNHYNITETSYNFTLPHANGDIFEFEVTPFNAFGRAVQSVWTSLYVVLTDNGQGYPHNNMSCSGMANITENQTELSTDPVIMEQQATNVTACAKDYNMNSSRMENQTELITEQAITVTATSCAHATMSGIGLGVPVGAIATVILIALVMVCSYSFPKTYLCPWRRVRKFQHNPAYESCSPKREKGASGTLAADNPAYESCSPTRREETGTSNRLAADDHTYATIASSQERVYEDIM